MGFKDYNQKYVVINGVTNEQIAVPKALVNSKVTGVYSVNEIMLIDTILAELVDSESVTIFKSYMKD